jgi:hypothetical protein
VGERNFQAGLRADNTNSRSQSRELLKETFPSIDSGHSFKAKSHIVLPLRGQHWTMPMIKLRFSSVMAVTSFPFHQAVAWHLKTKTVTV